MFPASYFPTRYFAPRYWPKIGAVAAVVVATAAAGKYKPEHDSALAALGAATGFSSEHASALRDLRDAG